jgi:uncharacterized protein (DUF433 family)
LRVISAIHFYERLARQVREDNEAKSMEATDRIEVNAAICGGKPVVRGTRIMVRNILGMVAGGYTIDKILASYPDLSRGDVAAALEYAAQVVDEDQVVAR